MINYFSEGETINEGIAKIKKKKKKNQLLRKFKKKWNKYRME